MSESELGSNTAAADRPRRRNVLTASLESIKRHRALFLGFGIVTAVAAIPLYFTLIPPLVDLAEHIMISKLLWEKLAGLSHLDIEISSFLGYRLLPYSIAGLIAIFKTLGISLIYLPKTVAFALIAFHSSVVMTILYFTAREANAKRSFVYAVVFALPAIVVMYSACWFIGFVNFTLGLSFVVLAVGLTEWFLRDGRPMTAALLFVTLFLAFMAHPFAPVFWVAWGFCRGVMSLPALSFRAEWKRLLMMPVFFLPVFFYNYFATKNTELAPRDVFVGISPFVSFNYWWTSRMGEVVNGSMLAADDASSGTFFAVFFLVVVVLTLVLTFIWGSRRLRAIMLTCVAFFLLTSTLNERFFPTPGLHWLAYGLRFYSAAAMICLTVTGMVLLRVLANPARNRRKTLVVVIMAAYCVIASAGHVISVSRAYNRFDPVGREYVEKVFMNEPPAMVIHTYWNPDGTYLGNYRCLIEPDCNPPGSAFYYYGGDLYAVKIRSTEQRSSPGSADAAGPEDPAR